MRAFQHPTHHDDGARRTRSRELAAWLVDGAITNPDTVCPFIVSSWCESSSFWFFLLDAAERSGVTHQLTRPGKMRFCSSSGRFEHGGRVVICPIDELETLRGLYLAHVAIEEAVCERAQPVVVAAILCRGGAARLVARDGRMLPFAEVPA